MPRRFRTTPLVLICAVVAASLAAAAPAAAETFTVNDASGDFGDASIGDAICDVGLDGDLEPECTLRAAVDEANFSADAGDEVVFDAVVTTILLAAPLEITSPLTIQGNGSGGPDGTHVSGAGATRAFDIAPTGPTTLNDVLISDAAVGADGGGGAAIRTAAATTLNRVTVQGNALGGLTEEGSGAGILGTDPASELTLTASAVIDNVITTDGDALTPSGASGAGIASAGPLSLTETTVSGNQILDGGGTFARGGGIRADAGLTVTRSTISGNAVNGGAAEGAGISAGSASAARSIANSTISANSAPASGAGGAQLGEDATIVNTTFAENSGGAGGGADLIAAGAETAVSAQNTIFASPDACREDAGAALTGTNNIDAGKSCGLTGAGNRQDTDPALGPLSLNAPGSTMTHAIALGSPALDAADTACGGGLLTDQRGFARSLGGPRCDVGAYEARHRLLTASRTGTGSGSVIGTGIACGGDCSQSYVDGTTVILTATASAGSDFSAWAGCDSVVADACTVVLGGDRMVSAGFALEPVPQPPPTAAAGTVTTAPVKKCRKGFKRVEGKCKRAKKKGKKKKRAAPA